MTDDSNDNLLSVLCLLGFYTILVLKVVVEEGVDFERMLWLQERKRETTREDIFLHMTTRTKDT